MRTKIFAISPTKTTRWQPSFGKVASQCRFSIRFAKGLSSVKISWNIRTDAVEDRQDLPREGHEDVSRSDL